MSASTVARPRGYLIQEGWLIVAWAYAILAAGSITGLANFRIHAANVGLAAFVLGGWLIIRLVRGRLIPRSGFELGIILFTGAMLLATFSSIDVRRSLATLAGYLTYVLAFYYWLDLYRGGLPQELVEKTLLIVVAINIGFSLYDAAEGIQAWRAVTLGGTLPFGPPFLHRAYTLLGDANLGAAVINLTIPLAVMRAWRGRTLVRVGWGVYLFLALLTVYFTSSRGGWLATAAELAAMAFFAALLEGRLAGGRWGMEGLLRPLAAAMATLRRRPLLAVAAGVLSIGLVLGAGALLLRQSVGPTHGSGLQARSSFWRAAWLAFASDPLTGTGPGTYPSAFTRYGGIPPDRPYLHAHSVPFTLLAETGLNGGVGLIVLLTTMAAAFERRRRNPVVAVPEAEAGPSAAGPLAALVGLSVHSLFDHHLMFTSVAFPAIALAAAVFHNPIRPRTPALAARRPPGISPLWLIVPGLAALGVSLYSLRAEATAETAIQAADRGDWRAAAAIFDQASSQDPGLAFYQLQAGYAYGRLAAPGDPEALETAIARYESGIRLEPAYSLNHATLGVLYLQAGRPEEARAAFRQAITVAGQPGSWLYWLHYGIATEQIGDDDAAVEAYLSAIRLRPSIAEASFWRETEVSQRALAVWSGEAAAASPTESLERGFHVIEQGDVQAAQAAFEQAWREGPLRPGVYRGLAMAARERGDLDSADLYFSAALSLQTAENESKLPALLDWADLALMRHELVPARERYEAAFAAVSDATVFGWGTQDFTPYGWFVFNRGSLSNDLLPQMIRADVTESLAARLLPLGELRAQAGDRAGATEVYQRLLELDPALTEARTRLADLDASQD